jgi:hypothetical protein
LENASQTKVTYFRRRLLVAAPAYPNTPSRLGSRYRRAPAVLKAMVMTQQRRRWTEEDIARLLNMAQKYPVVQIASEIGRPVGSIRTKAHELAISLRIDRPQHNEQRQ